MKHDHDGGGKSRSIGTYVLIGFALIAGYFLITEHRAHAVQWLPFLLLAACPLMHLFHGHGGHGGHGSKGKDEEPRRSPPSSEPAPTAKNQDSEQQHHH